MELTDEMAKALAAPFDERDIEYLPGRGGGKFAYLDRAAVMDRLDAAVGAGNWSFSFEPLTPDGKAIKGRLTICGITREDAGQAKDEGEPIKAAVSDSFKRCADMFGVGRYLRDGPPQQGSGARPQQQAPQRQPVPDSRGDTRATRGPVTGKEWRTRVADAAAAKSAPAVISGGETGEASGSTCVTHGCGTPLTRGQHQVSMNAFGVPLCPNCQRQKARAA
jgi:hypothetical protein